MLFSIVLKGEYVKNACLDRRNKHVTLLHKDYYSPTFCV